MAAPLKEDDEKLEKSMSKAMREVKKSDIEYFEGEFGLWHVFNYLIKSLVMGKEKAVTAENFYLYMDWSNKDYSR